MILDEEPEDPLWLLDHDWLEINKLRRAYKDGGDKALDKALVDLLETDAMQFARVACAFDPDNMPQHFKDSKLSGQLLYIDVLVDNAVCVEQIVPAQPPTRLLSAVGFTQILAFGLQRPPKALNDSLFGDANLNGV